MRRTLSLAATASLLTLTTFGQGERIQTFLVADVHVSAKAQNQGMRPPATRGDLYEIKNATMADLIGLAYNSNTSKVVGGPSWLEMNRFDVTARQPPQSTPEAQRLMLQSLLADRFKLAVREETRPMPNYVLTAGTKPRIKEADGSGDTGCKPQSSNAAPGAGTLRIGIAGENGTPVQLTLTDGAIEYKCRNMTMETFASGLRGLLGVSLGINPVIDQTGLKGLWNFDLKYSIGLINLSGAAGSQITIFEAVDKQLGLKLEQTQVPTPVVVVENVNQKPTDNPPGTAEALPRISVPTEFEVATIKPTSPDSKRSAYQFQNGRLTSEGLPLAFLIARAFNPGSSAQLIGVPTWAERARFDVLAQVPSEASVGTLDPDTMAPMMLALLKERFKLTYHTEQRELQAYDLVAAKPKMQKADPSQRAWCKSPAQVPGAPPAPQGSQALICQNITMTQFADLLRGRVPGLDMPIRDLTEVEGGWNFTLTFNPLASLVLARPAAEAAAPGVMPAASDPVIVGQSLFEAVEKQLGLKLEKNKRSGSVTVIDHIDEMPSDN